MARNAQEVTEAELAVLKVLWETGTATCRRIVEELYPDGTAASYATVQKLLERLETKEFVRRDRSAHVHLFSARVPRTELIGRGLRALAERLCDGALSPLLTCLVEGRTLTRDERAALRELLAERPRAPKETKR
jgi:predicted transcriptional regulator